MFGIRMVGSTVMALSLVLGGCATGGTGGDPGPVRQTINHTGQPMGPLFSPIVRTGDLYFLSGVIGRSADGEIGAATRQAMDGVRTRLEAVGATMDDLVKCQVFLVDMDDYQGMNEVYASYFTGDPPARTALAVRALPANAQVEVTCIAAVR